MKGGGDGRLKRLTNFFIEALFYLERADRGLSHPDAVDPDEIDDPEECNESIEEAKKNIMKLPERYGSEIPGLNEKGMRIYIDKITKHFHDVYSDDLIQYPRVDNDIVDKCVIESIDESRLAGKSKKKKKKKATKKKKKATKKKKKATKKRKGKLAGNPKCQGLEENDCRSNDRCAWNEFHIEDFDMNTSKGKQKLFDLKESLMKRYTKDELREYLGSEDPSFYQVYMGAKKEYDNGLRGLCGNKIFKGSELSDILKKRVKKDYPDIKSKKKSKIPLKDKDLGKKLLLEAMKKNKPDKEIQAIIDKYGLHEKELQEIYDKDDERLFSGIDRFLSVDHDEVSSLMGMVEDEVKLEQKGDSHLQARINKLQGKSGYKKKRKKEIKTKKAKKKKSKK